MIIDDITQYFEPIWPITKVQRMFYEDIDHRIFVIPAGRRSRKTLISTHKLLYSALEKKGNYVCAAPTFRQVKRIFWDRIRTMTKPFTKKISMSEYVIELLNGSTISLIGLKVNPERIEGAALHGIVISEADSCGEKVWQYHVEPALADTQGFAILDGVPDGGLGWYYRLSLKVCGGALPERDESIAGSVGTCPEMPDHVYYHWYSSDVLPPDVIRQIEETTDPKVFRQEYKGSFESFAGRAYYAFSAKNIVTPQQFSEIVYQHTRHIGSPLRIPGMRYNVGIDFNVNPMTACIHAKIGGVEYTVGEVRLDNSNTPEMSDHLSELFPDKRVVALYPDSTGKNRRSNADVTDIQYLQEPRHAGWRVIAGKSNPPQRSRLNVANCLLHSGKWKVLSTCKHLINDLNLVTRSDDGRIAEGQDEKLIHQSDAATYPLYRMYPMFSGSVEKAV